MRPQGFCLVVVHEKVGLIQYAADSEIEDLSANFSVKDNGRSTQRAKGHGILLSCHRIIDDLVPDENVAGIEAMLALYAHEHAPFARLCFCCIQGQKLWIANRRNAVFSWTAIIDKCQIYRVFEEIGL